MYFGKRLDWGACKAKDAIKCAPGAAVSLPHCCASNTHGMIACSQSGNRRARIAVKPHTVELAVHCRQSPAYALCTPKFAELSQAAHLFGCVQTTISGVSSSGVFQAHAFPPSVHA